MSKKKKLQTRSVAEIEARLDEVEADERMHYKCANVNINAPLALIQVNLDTESTTLRWVLGLAPLKKKKKTQHVSNDGT